MKNTTESIQIVKTKSGPDGEILGYILPSESWAVSGEDVENQGHFIPKETPENVVYPTGGVTN